jgi:hypothetical protein
MADYAETSDAGIRPRRDLFMDVRSVGPVEPMPYGSARIEPPEPVADTPSLVPPGFYPSHAGRSGRAAPDR